MKRHVIELYWTEKEGDCPCYKEQYARRLHKINKRLRKILCVMGYNSMDRLYAGDAETLKSINLFTGECNPPPPPRPEPVIE